MITAEVILDSINEQGNRLTTYKLRYWRAIHAELLTHRMFSRNASSSRAIPFAKLIEEATTFDLMAMPEVWGTEQKGMQVAAPLNFDYQCTAEAMWLRAAINAAESAKDLAALGVHKSIINRLLEPFTHINVVISSTEFDNFFGLRLDAAAEPTMRALAVAMWEARKASVPKLLLPGHWHLPFVTKEDCDTGGIYDEFDAIKVSAARCARTSYLSFDTGKRSTFEEDIRLYEKLMGAQPLHSSPCEHQATPDQIAKAALPLIEGERCWEYPEQHGNFRGFRQWRKMIPDEAIAPLPEEYR